MFRHPGLKHEPDTAWYSKIKPMQIMEELGRRRRKEENLWKRCYSGVLVICHCAQRLVVSYILRICICVKRLPASFDPRGIRDIVYRIKQRSLNIYKESVWVNHVNEKEGKDCGTTEGWESTDNGHREHLYSTYGGGLEFLLLRAFGSTGLSIERGTMCRGCVHSCSRGSQAVIAGLVVELLKMWSVEKPLRARLSLITGEVLVEYRSITVNN